MRVPTQGMIQSRLTVPQQKDAGRPRRWGTYGLCSPQVTGLAMATSALRACSPLPGQGTSPSALSPPAGSNLGCTCHACDGNSAFQALNHWAESHQINIKDNHLFWVPWKADLDRDWEQLQTHPGCSAGLLLSGLTSLDLGTSGPKKNCRCPHRKIWRPRATGLANGSLLTETNRGQYRAGQGKRVLSTCPWVLAQHTHCTKSHPLVCGGDVQNAGLAAGRVPGKQTTHHSSVDPPPAAQGPWADGRNQGHVPSSGLSALPGSRACGQMPWEGSLPSCGCCQQAAEQTQAHSVQHLTLSLKPLLTGTAGPNHKRQLWAHLPNSPTAEQRLSKTWHSAPQLLLVLTLCFLREWGWGQQLSLLKSSYTRRYIYKNETACEAITIKIMNQDLWWSFKNTPNFKGDGARLSRQLLLVLHMEGRGPQPSPTTKPNQQCNHRFWYYLTQNHRHKISSGAR